MRVAVAAVFLAGAGLAAPVPKELKKADDKTRILGTWKIDRATRDGKELAQYSPVHTLTFHADGTLVFNYFDGDAPQVRAWKLDEAASPKQLLWGARPTPSDNRRLYAFRGDKLVVARRQNNVLPTSLEPGPGIIVIEYERVVSK
jgi:uncharacterized protein (TIGR03067 family)